MSARANLTWTTDVIRKRYMGTNFYGWKKGTYHPSTFAAIDDKSLVEAYDYTENELEITNIHLGKRSAGWNFLAQMNDSVYYTNKEEYLGFCRTLEIRDEYGALMDFEKFVEIVNVSKGKQHLNTGITADGLEFLNCKFS